MKEELGELGLEDLIIDTAIDFKLKIDNIIKLIKK
jgi:hypothetical protein